LFVAILIWPGIAVGLISRNLDYISGDISAERKLPPFIGQVSKILVLNYLNPS
jgi:hypothetical protein